MPKKAVVGIRCGDVKDIASILTQVREAGFDYICANIVFDRIVAKNMDFGVENLSEPFSWSDMAISSSEWGSGVVGILSNLEEQLESQDKILAQRAEDALAQQLNYAQHLGLPSVLVEPSRPDTYHLARILLARIVQPLSNVPFWMKMPMGASQSVSDMGEGDRNETEVTWTSKPWHCWNKVRTLCNHERKLFPVLELDADVPSEKEVARWLGEPVKAIFISPDIFTTNHKGYPVLSKAHQTIVRKFFGIGAQIVINPKGFHEDLKYYKQYIDYMWNNMREEENGDDPLLNFSRGYEDYLQCPLQPLMDNLESHTYEVFEKDPIKYDLYESAIYEALLSKAATPGFASEPLVIMVVGAGRGPLVHASLHASNKAGISVRVYAIEKNANAVNTLLHLQSSAWAGKGVSVHWTDMRSWKATEKADIMVSELLGSFGDNELSPECLDGAQSFLKENGIMIPQSYTSFISPVMSAKLYSEVRTHRDADKYPNTHYETPYVVHMHNMYPIADPQPLFKFEHPNFDKSRYNDRYGNLTFRVQQDCLFHGFAGYFESVLFGNILMSIHPETHSPGMFSWFPIYFPVREPVFLKEDDKLVANFWRKSSPAHVWYEWAISSPVALSIHNSTGKAYNIGLSS